MIMQALLIFGVICVQGILGVEITNGDAVTVAAGELLHLSCEDDQGDDLVWYFGGIPVEEDHRHIVTDAKRGTTSTSYLAVEDASDADGGRYECKSQVDPIFGVAEVQVTITGAAEETESVDIVEPSGSESKTPVGQSFSLKCQSPATVNVQWFKDDEQLQDETDGFIINTQQDAASGRDTSMLTKEEAGVEDSATYSCRAESDANNADSIDVMVVDPDTDGESDAESAPEANAEEDEDADDSLESGADGTSDLAARSAVMCLALAVPLIAFRERF